MKKQMKFALPVLAGLLALSFGLANAGTEIIDQAKSTCTVGEKIDGYLGAVPGKTVSTEVNQEMRSVNQQRKAVYADLANQNGVTVEDTGKLFAEKLIAKAAPGHCVQNGNGEWVQIPSQ